MVSSRFLLRAAVLSLLLCANIDAHAADVRNAIEVANASLAQALTKGDAKAAAQHYTDDAILIPPGGAPIARGTAAIEAFWRSQIAAGIKDLKLTTVDVESSGDLAYEFGEVAVTGNDLQTFKGHYIVVWKLTGAQWKLHRDIWN